MVRRVDTRGKGPTSLAPHAISARARGLGRRTESAVRFALLCMLLRLAAPLAIGQTYCAFTVTVKSPSGKSLAGVPVGFIRNGKSEITEGITSRNGEVRYCDAGLEPIDVVVGETTCGQVVVRNVYARWPDPKRVLVLYDPGPCPSPFTSTACQILFRVTDQAGNPIEGARLISTPAEKSSTASDKHGRLYLTLKQGDRISGRIQYGTMSAEIEESCRVDGERIVKLVRSR